MKKELALGMMRLPTCQDKKIDFEKTRQLVDYFIEQGFRKFDTAEIYHDTCSEHAVRECIVKRHARDSFEIADKLSSWRIQENSSAEQFFQKQLQVTGLEYFDRYLVHSVEERLYPDIVDKRYFDFIFEKKARGLVREAGFSFHGQPELLDKILAEYPEVDFVQLQINYLDWDSEGIQSRLCYEVATRHGVPVIVMEPVKGGTLATLPPAAEKLLKSIHPDWSIPSWAIRFAASLDNVFMVLSGMSNLQQLADNTAYMQQFEKLNETELNAIRQVVKILNEGSAIPCTNCSYCTDGCPMNIPIPTYFSLYNADLHEMEQEKKDWTAQEAYYSNLTTEQSKVESCIACGRCEQVCPQHLPIIQLLKDVSKHFQ